MLLNPLFHPLPVNRHGRDFVVGDIHGRIALLGAVLASFNFDPTWGRLIALGDLIDHCPNSRAVLEMVRDEPWFDSLRGNHEAMFNGSIDDRGVERTWRRSDGKWADLMPKKVLRERSLGRSGAPHLYPIAAQGNLS